MKTFFVFAALFVAFPALSADKTPTAKEIKQDFKKLGQDIGSATKTFVKGAAQETGKVAKNVGENVADTSESVWSDIKRGVKKIFGGN